MSTPTCSATATSTCADHSACSDEFCSRRAIQQINRAVNHRPNGEPTLIQRVARLEQNSSLHAEWSAQVLVAVAEQVGVDIPARPEPVTECDQ
jgi:hypothetical protein